MKNTPPPLTAITFRATITALAASQVAAHEFVGSELRYMAAQIEGGETKDDVKSPEGDLHWSIETPFDEKSVPPPDARYRFRPHGWHWWRGQSGEKGVMGYTAPAQWHAVHCWIAEGMNGVPMATAAHWPEPLIQSQMEAGTWGPEIIPPRLS